MSGSIESLRATLRTVDGCCNDHDFIVRCRPVDVRAVLQEVERLRALLAADYTTQPCGHTAKWLAYRNAVLSRREGTAMCDTPTYAIRNGVVHRDGVPIDELTELCELAGSLAAARQEVERLRASKAELYDMCVELQKQVWGLLAEQAGGDE